MPFTPKFVDLVRNVTSSTGTGAITLGSAVSGFTSLIDAVGQGEQFYYCIQGIDKPAEREVGRGTMQAGGTVARQPISGPATNFTTGTKTIALIAAAEWFAKVEAGGSGGGGSVAAGLAELAALPTANGAAALLTAKGREGLFVFDTSNLSSRVTADPNKGIHVAPAAAPTGVSGAWVRKYDGPVNVRWFGAVGDFVTDDLPAFDAALALIKATLDHGQIAGGSLRIPAGRYFLGGSWNIHVPVNIIGDGSLQGAGGTLLRFPNNVNGVVFNKGNTHGDGLGTQGDSSGSRMEALQLWGGNVNVDGTGAVTSFAGMDSPTGHGVRIRATFITLRDIFAAFWGGDGFHNVTNSGAGGYTEGNGNNFTLDQCQSIYNRGAGFTTAGTDSNAGTFNTCSAISNSGGGFIEYSFLGNTYLQCHTRDCGVNCTIGGTDDPTGTCTYGGLKYHVMPGQQIAASTTIPGTDASVWGPTSAFANRPWVTGKTWAIGSPFATNPTNVNAANVVVGLYTEDSQMPVAGTYPSLFIGGLHNNVGFIGSGSNIGGTSNGGLLAGEFVTSDGIAKSARFGSPDGDRVFFHSRGDGVSNLQLKSVDNFFGKKAVELLVGNSEFQVFNIGFEETHFYGYGSFGVSKLYIGNGNIATGSGRKLWNAGSTADLNGVTVAQGDTFLYYNPVAGGAAGFRCTTGGVGGAGAVFDEFGAPPPGEATAAQIRTGTATTKYISPGKLFDAAAPVALADGATINIDGSAGINFNVVLGGNRTLANPANMKPGQSGRIRVKQDATGSRTLSFGVNWLFAGGDPVMSSAANAIDVIAYFANAANEIEATIAKALS